VPKLDRTLLSRIRADFAGGPLYFTASFDGSQRFAMWIDTLAVAREIRRDQGKRVRFSYFINSCYYDPTVKGSLIGRAHSREEVLVRTALTQVAINEGHDIGNHGVRHEDGGAWPVERWRRELDEFHAAIDPLLYWPVRDEHGEPVFPRFEPVEGVASGQTGARCERDADCATGRCLAITDKARFCTESCNRKHACPRGTACGTPNFVDDTDVCVPVPLFPVTLDGEVLFDQHGHANPKHPELERYRIVGFRAPFLSYDDGTTQALIERRYRYDASQLAEPGPPLKIAFVGADRALFGFPLMQHRGTRTIPMDYNYRQVGADGARMLADYRTSLLAAYQDPARTPWSIGHHFADWHGGAYHRALKDTLRWAAAGCVVDGKKSCEALELPSYRRLAKIISRKLRRKSR
jgi:peptidoglycan/xylan/chitin deacetylase (PgdA/CDA1 family)